MEAMLRVFTPGYSPDECGRGKNKRGQWDLDAWKWCTLRKLHKAFGPVHTTGGARGGQSGLKLLAPKNAFNHYGCHTEGRGPIINCKDDSF